MVSMIQLVYLRNGFRVSCFVCIQVSFYPYLIQLNPEVFTVGIFEKYRENNGKFNAMCNMCMAAEKYFILYAIK